MDNNRNKRNGEIFPDLRRESPESAHETDWEERPLKAESAASVKQVRREVDVRQIYDAKTGSLWMAFALLLIILAGVSFYGYRVLQESNIQVSQVPEMLKSMTAMNGRLGDVEGKLHSWATDWQSLSERLARLEKTARANFQSARKHSEALNAQLEQRIQDRLDGRDHILDTRLDQLESDQRSAVTRVNELRQELADARQEIASLRRETNTDLALLHHQASGNDEQVTAIARQLEHERVNFEVAKNQVASIVPDISVNLTATDVRYQRFSGWVYYLPDQRFLWVRDHGVQQPVVFYGRNNSQQYQVVITSVRDASAAGYVLLPREGGVTQQATASTAGGK